MDQKDLIEKLMKKYNLNFTKTQTEVFINHLESFYDRLINQVDVGLELNDDLRSQINQAVWKKTESLVNDYLTELKVQPNIVVPEAEVFLIATHLSLL